MSNVDTTAQTSAFGARGLVAPGLAAGLYAATLFVSAVLLFAVQPMFTKMVLPKLGGSPAVWSTAMVAFQAFLFAGYLYAHVISRTLTPVRAAMVHLAVLAAVAATLAARHRAGLRRSSVERNHVLADRSVRRVDRRAVRGAVRLRAAVAELVHRHRPSDGEESLCPLRRIEPRFVCRAARLSVPDRAVLHARRLKPPSGRSPSRCWRSAFASPR